MVLSWLMLTEGCGDQMLRNVHGAREQSSPMEGMPRPPPCVAVGSDAHERLAGCWVKGLDMTGSRSGFLWKVL